MAVFYALSILIGIPLFVGLPVLVQSIGGWLGQSWSRMDALTMTVVAINLHHFIVDRYIWRSSGASRPGASQSSSSG